MNKIPLILVVLIFVGVAVLLISFGSDPSKNAAQFSTPTPTITPTPEQTPIPAADIVQVDTSQDGPILTVDAEAKKSLNCDKYNQVAINASGSTVTIKGACAKITINGDGNQITADAAAEFALNGGSNKVSYSRFENGKRPIVTENQAGNTADFVPANVSKQPASANKAKK